MHISVIIDHTNKLSQVSLGLGTIQITDSFHFTSLRQDAMVNYDVEILPIVTKKQEHIRDLFLNGNGQRRYPRPSRVLYDLGGEFDNIAPFVPS